MDVYSVINNIQRVELPRVDVRLGCGRIRDDAHPLNHFLHNCLLDQQVVPALSSVGGSGWFRSKLKAVRVNLEN
ncbi:hypothetical protein ROHU_014529 [Labeo rohita]|uniref:Uncharacterized protein n=1 Tax=Labeo rohita TaxID=84645 RepID=A0A498NT82_LABRO|nr:hypothetical protein ROHU_014529 [Labeo rohita]